MTASWTSQVASRARAFVRVAGPMPGTTSSGCSPTTSEPRGGRLLRGAAPDAEGPRDRADARVAARRATTSCSSPSRSSARRCAPRSCACASRRQARSSSRSTPRRSSSAGRGGIPTTTTGARASEVIDAALEPHRSTRTRSSRCGSTPGRLAWARRSTSACCRPSRARSSAPSRSRRAATRARSRRAAALPRPREPRGCACSTFDGDRRRRCRRRPHRRREGRRSGDERRPRRTVASSGSPTCAARSPTARACRSTGQAAARPLLQLNPRARSSGDRAQPCGG